MKRREIQYGLIRMNDILNDKEAINEVYIQWLYSKVGSNDREYNHYWRVIRRLYRREFYYIVKNDVNRYEDGLTLRNKFTDEYGYSFADICRALDGPCTVLEMLVAFAMRIDSEIMWDPDAGDRTAFWFWTMLQNAGLDMKRFSDEYFDNNCIIALEKMITRVVSRQYDKLGNGGFFPVSSYQKNFQRTELWYQMHFWMHENYPI